MYGAGLDFQTYEANRNKVAKAAVGLVFNDESGYCTQWSYRALQTSRRQFVDQFDVPRNCTPHRFADAFPDQATHVTTWASHLQAPTIHSFARRVGYDISLYWLTLFQCLLTDSKILAIDPDLMATSKFCDAVKRIRKCTRDRYGHDGLPKEICVLAAQQCL